MWLGLALALALGVVSGCAGVDQSGRASTSDGRRDAAGPWEGRPCDAGSVRACPEIAVTVPASTPVGTLVFDRASLTYEIGFGTTSVVLAPGNIDARPQLSATFDGQPVTGALGAGGPGDHSAKIDLFLCDGTVLKTIGVVHVYANEVTVASEAGTQARLDAALRVQGPGWQIDSRFAIPSLCAIVNAP